MHASRRQRSAVLALLLAAACTGLYQPAPGEVGRPWQERVAGRVEGVREALTACRERLDAARGAFNALTVEADEERRAVWEAQLTAGVEGEQELTVRIESVRRTGKSAHEQWSEAVSALEHPTVRREERARLVEARERHRALLEELERADAAARGALEELRSAVRGGTGRPTLAARSQAVHDRVTAAVAALQSALDETDEFLAAEART